MHFDIPECFFPLIYLFVISIHYPCLVNKVNNNCSIFIIITQYNHSPSIYSNNNLDNVGSGEGDTEGGLGYLTRSETKFNIPVQLQSITNSKIQHHSAATYNNINSYS